MFTSLRRLVPGIALAAVTLAVAAPCRADLADDLLAYYAFDGNGADGSGHGLDLGLFGGVGFAPGLFGQALDLHRNNSQYAARPIDDPVLDFGPNDFTIQVWANFNSMAGEQVLIEKFQSATPPGWSLTKLGDDRLHLSPEPAFSSPLGGLSGSWHQFVARRSGATFDLILDGSILATGAAVTLADTAFPLLIGKRNERDGRDFSVDGRLDEVAIWGRALSDAEISSLYNGGAGMPVIPVPEPSSLALAALGLLGVVVRRSSRPR